MSNKNKNQKVVAEARKSGGANLIVTVGAIVAILLVGGVFLQMRASGAGADATASSEQPEPASDPQVVRDNSHFLDRAEGSDVTLVEFLDFECESCKALYPVVEDVRKQYAGQINVVMRYFPIPSHTNAVNAALAVEAAANQGKLEDMYSLMYQTQEQWGEQQVSKADVFRGFAEELNLDMERFDADVAAPETLERVRFDQADGLGLGVEGTPTFFLNGEKLQLASVEDLTSAIDSALEEQ